MSRVFILGAGASAFAGFPLAKNLWRWVVQNWSDEYMAGQRRDETVAVLEPILRRFAQAEDGPFPFLLSRFLSRQARPAFITLDPPTVDRQRGEKAAWDNNNCATSLLPCCSVADSTACDCIHSKASLSTECVRVRL